MRKQKIVVLLAAAFLLAGYSGYYGTRPGQELTESAEAAPEQTGAPAIGDSVGPGGGVPSSDNVIVESLELPDTPEAAMNPEIFIATDIHYLAKELTDFGEAFEQMSENGDGKVTPYVWEILDTFLDVVVERKPQA